MNKSDAHNLRRDLIGALSKLEDWMIDSEYLEEHQRAVITREKRRELERLITTGRGSNRQIDKLLV